MGITPTAEAQITKQMTIGEFEALIPTDDSCKDYLETRRGGRWHLLPPQRQGKGLPCHQSLTPWAVHPLFRCRRIWVSVVAQANKTGVEAGQAASSALLRAARLEKEAADTRLAAEKLKQVVRWRELSSTQIRLLEQSLRASPGTVSLRYTDGDPEALYLFLLLGRILQNSGWKVKQGALKMANALVFGIFVNGQGRDAEALRTALANARVGFSNQTVPSGIEFFSEQATDSTPMLMVGSKLPPAP